MRTTTARRPMKHPLMTLIRPLLLVAAISGNAMALELVMTPGMRIGAATSTGKIEIVAGEGLFRSYTWEGETRSVCLIPREKRWYGSLGAYYPGPGRHWRIHNGITRGVLQEGQQHFRTVDEAMAWLREQRGYHPLVHRNDGLVVVFGKVAEREQLNVEVWQIFIGGKKPAELQGSADARITVTTPKP